MPPEEPIKNSYMMPLAILISGVIIGWAIITASTPGDKKLIPLTDNASGITAPIAAGSGSSCSISSGKLVQSSTGGVILPIRLDDLGKKLVKSGAIDQEKFIALYSQQGGLTAEEKSLLDGSENDKIIITEANAGFLLNLFWALGLANKNEILEQGPMVDPRYGSPARFASTGGWTLARDDAMLHYSKHSFIELTPEQQALVEKVAKNIYRPCCNNPTHFPDCNHGMAMLGFLGLAASQGANEEQIYEAALILNAYWFPDTYVTLANYFELTGQNEIGATPKYILSSAYSSAAGYNKVLQQIEPANSGGGGGCSVSG